MSKYLQTQMACNKRRKVEAVHKYSGIDLNRCKQYTDTTE